VPIDGGAGDDSLFNSKGDAVAVGSTGYKSIVAFFFFFDQLEI